jgi:hypothetical protein
MEGEIAGIGWVCQKGQRNCLLQKCMPADAAETNVYGQLLWGCLNFVQF